MQLTALRLLSHQYCRFCRRRLLNRVTGVSRIPNTQVPPTPEKLCKDSQEAPRLPVWSLPSVAGVLLIFKVHWAAAAIFGRRQCLARSRSAGAQLTHLHERLVLA